MKKSITNVGETEMEILHIVWELGEATVSDVHYKILERRKVAYTTIMTIMKNLYTKGLLQYRKDGMSYVYKAAKKPEDVRMKLANDLIEKVFKGSSVALFQALVSKEKIDAKELAEIKRMIDEMEDGNG